MGFFGPIARPMPVLPVTSNLALRLDASNFASIFDATTGGNQVSDGGTVARWEDQSGNARHATQGTANNRPIFKLFYGDVGGICFDGSNDSLIGDLFASAPSSETVFIIGIIDTKSSTGAFGRLFSQYPSGGLDYTQTGHYIPLIQGSADTSLGSYASSSARSTGTPRFILPYVAAKHSGTQLVTRFCGENNTAYTHTLGAGSIFAKYSVGGFDNFLRCTIFEVLVYSTNLSDTDLESIETYAKNKIRWYFR